MIELMKEKKREKLNAERDERTAKRKIQKTTMEHDIE